MCSCGRTEGELLSIALPGQGPSPAPPRSPLLSSLRRRAPPPQPSAARPAPAFPFPLSVAAPPAPGRSLPASFPPPAAGGGAAVSGVHRAALAGRRRRLSRAGE